MTPIYTALLRLTKQRIAYLTATALMTASLSSPAIAQDFRPSVSQTLAYENGAVLTDDATGQSMSFESTLVSLTQFSLQRRTTDGAQLSFGASLEVTRYPNINKDDTNLWGFTGTYRVTLDDDRKWQLTLQAEHANATTGDNWSFERSRVGARLQYRHNRTNIMRARVRVGHRNQNDALFEGFDQNEFFAEISHEWRPNADRLMYSATIYGEARRADLDQYSYVESGVRLRARRPITKDTELNATLSAYSRTFDGAFSSTNALVRDDVRWQANVRLDHSFNQTLNGYVSLGWDENQSNISARDYAGLTLGVGLSVSWE